MVNRATAGVALVWAALLIGGSAAPALAQSKELSDKSVLTLMRYAWGMVPNKFTTPLGKTIEVGMLLTGGDKTVYRGGVYDRIRPASPVSAGGIGAIQLNARYDYLDLIDNGIVGGKQQTAGLSAIWIPIEYVRFVVNYGHLWIDDAAVPAGTDTDYSVDTFGLRAQFDF